MLDFDEGMVLLQITDLSSAHTRLALSVPFSVDQYRAFTLFMTNSI